MGSARYVRDPKDKSRAEFAVTIVDSHQGRGIGSLLIAVLAAHAQRNGIETFTGIVSPDNAVMLSLLERMGAKQVGESPSEIEIALPVAGIGAYRGRLSAEPEFSEA